MKPAPQHWWVNHKQAHEQKLAGELWLPKRGNMSRVRPGDVMFCFVDAAVEAVGVALGRAWEADCGWRVPMRLLDLENPLRPKDHASALAPVLPAERSPLRPSGAGKPGVFLAMVPAAMAAVLRELLRGQVEDIERRIQDAAGPDLADEMVEDAIQQRTDIGSADKERLIRARRGQGVFRQNIERIESACRLTGVLDRRHLRASHIKPWGVCDDQEKLDGYNGLLLSPHIAHLFERGYVSFSDEGELLVSRYLNPAVLKAWNLTLPVRAGAFRAEQRVYLDYHRRELFDRPEGGRRSGTPSG